MTTRVGLLFGAGSHGLGGGRESRRGEVADGERRAASGILQPGAVPARYLMQHRSWDLGNGGTGLRGSEKRVLGPQQNMVGAVIWPSSSLDMMLSARGRRKPSIARIRELTVRALPGRRAARRSTSSRSSGAAAAAAGLSPWPSSRRYTRRGMGLRSTASPRNGTVSSDKGIRTVAPGNATAGSPMATSEAIRPGRAAAYHIANIPPSE
jgi:hypothetical protein